MGALTTENELAFRHSADRKHDFVISHMAMALLVVLGASGTVGAIMWAISESHPIAIPLIIGPAAVVAVVLTFLFWRGCVNRCNECIRLSPARLSMRFRGKTREYAYEDILEVAPSDAIDVRQTVIRMRSGASILVPHDLVSFDDLQRALRILIDVNPDDSAVQSLELPARGRLAFKLAAFVVVPMVAIVACVVFALAQEWSVLPKLVGCGVLCSIALVAASRQGAGGFRVKSG